MRPIRRNESPQNKPFDDFTKAKPDLVSRLGPYCSYCERKITTQLAVEHIQPKGLARYVELIGRWDNFLLACINCNSTKKDKDVDLSEVLLPDRDNTFFALDYKQDGSVTIKNEMKSTVKNAAKTTLKLVGLDKSISQVQDENGKMVAIDRVSQRMESWLLAQETKKDIDSSPLNQQVRNCAVRIAKENGFFSIWMTVFANDIDMQQRLVNTFEGTAGSGCFEQKTMTPISPAPNPDGLSYGGKV